MKIQPRSVVSAGTNAPLSAVALNPIVSRMRTQRGACALRHPSH